MTFKDEAGEFWIEFWSLVPETESKKSIKCVLILSLNLRVLQYRLAYAPMYSNLNALVQHTFLLSFHGPLMAIKPLFKLF